MLELKISAWQRHQSSDVILEPANLLLKPAKGDRFDLDDEGDLELPETVTDGDKRGATPNETHLFDGTDIPPEDNGPRV